MKRRASLAIVSVLAGLAFSHLPARAQTVDTAEASKDAKTPRNVDIEADSDGNSRSAEKGRLQGQCERQAWRCDAYMRLAGRDLHRDADHSGRQATDRCDSAKKQTGTQTATDGGTQGAPGTAQEGERRLKSPFSTPRAMW